MGRELSPQAYEELKELVERVCEFVLTENVELTSGIQDGTFARSGAISTDGNVVKEKIKNAVAKNDPAKQDKTKRVRAVWIGDVIVRNLRRPRYSTKVLLQGIRGGVTKTDIQKQFCDFGKFKFAWSHKPDSNAKFGSIFIDFETSVMGRKFIESCTKKVIKGVDYYFRSCPELNPKEVVGVFPAVTQHLTYPPTYEKFGSKKTVFLSGIPSKLNSETLAKILTDLFGFVKSTALMRDSSQYPTGCGRATFRNFHSYMAAVATNYITVKTPQFTKRIRIVPFLRDSICSRCKGRIGFMFCKAEICLRYFCINCWYFFHNTSGLFYHKPLVRRRSTKTITWESNEDKGAVQNKNF